jgi:hypothetical protein
MALFMSGIFIEDTLKKDKERGERREDVSLSALKFEIEN